MSERPLWQPSPEQVETASLTAFMRRAEAQAGAPLRDYASLHRWSIESPERFWPLVWSFCNVVGDGPGPVRGARWGEMPGTRWFPEARLNFAENLANPLPNVRLEFAPQCRLNSRPAFAAVPASAGLGVRRPA